MMTGRILTIAIVGALCACGGGTAATGSAGTAGTGGASGSTTSAHGATGSTSSSGTAGSTGSGGGTPCEQCYPSCYLDAFLPCEKSSTCIEQVSGNTPPVTIDICYDNGVKVGGVVTTTGATATAYKADGTVCYTSGPGSDPSSQVWKDGLGKILFSETISAQGDQITCNGQTHTLPSGSEACTLCKLTMQPMCTKGTCTVP